MTQEELDQIRQIVREEVKREADPLHERIDTSGRSLRKDIEGIREEIRVTEKNLTKSISLEAKDLAEMITELMTAHQDHEERIIALEDEAGSKPTKH